MLANYLKKCYQLYKGQHKGLDLEMEELLLALSQSPCADYELVGNFTNIEIHHQEILAELSLDHHELQDSIKELHQLNDTPQHIKQQIRDFRSGIANNAE